MLSIQRYKGTALNGYEIHRKEWDLEVMCRVSDTLASPDGVSVANRQLAAYISSQSAYIVITVSQR